MKKICSKCGKEKDVNCFYKNKTRADSLDYWCKECHREYDKEWRKENEEKYKKYQRGYKRKWQKDNPEYHREYHKEYIQKPEVKEHQREYEKNRRANNPKFRLNNNISVAIRKSLRGNKAGKHWEDLVGYTLEQLRQRLEINFDKNMNWNNHGSYWSVDHWKPISLFNYTTPEEQTFKDCWSLCNLRPMEKIANIIKGNRF